MKTTVKKSFVILMTVAALSLAVLPTEAADNDRSGESEATVGFEANEEIIPPVDPEKPGTEFPGEGGPNGPLAIVYASSLRFGTVSLTGGELRLPVQVNRTLTPEAPAEEYLASRPHIQVADLRGSGEGWKVNANMSSFTITVDQEDEILKGAYLEFSGVRPSSTSADTLAPKLGDDEVRLYADDGDATEVRVLTADPKTGTGHWSMLWYPKESNEADMLHLVIPASVPILTGTYHAVITWTLEMTP